MKARYLAKIISIRMLRYSAEYPYKCTRHALHCWLYKCNTLPAEYTCYLEMDFLGLGYTDRLNNCSNSVLGFDAGEWDVEATKIQMLDNNNSNSSFQLHATTNDLPGDVEIVKVDTQRQPLYQVWSMNAYWWRILGCDNTQINI